MGLFKKKKNIVIEEYSETVIDDLEYNGVHAATGITIADCAVVIILANTICRKQGSNKDR